MLNEEFIEISRIRIDDLLRCLNNKAISFNAIYFNILPVNSHIFAIYYQLCLQNEKKNSFSLSVC